MYIKKLALKVNEFIMDDENTFYLINGIRKRTYAVKANPDALKYNVSREERRKSADQLLQQALAKVWRREGRRAGEKESVSVCACVRACQCACVCARARACV